MTLLIPQEALDLIIDQEVGSRLQYEREFMRPTWPGLSSGVTIGIGYDIGQTCPSESKLAKDWGAYIHANDIHDLARGCRIVGASARGLIDSMNHIVVPYDAAIKVFHDATIPAYYDLCRRNLANFVRLPGLCQGALVSLVYNRGAVGFNNTNDRFKEMRAIKDAMEKENYAAIPNYIREMKRLWEGKSMAGLLKRRDAEAAMFQKGLNPGLAPVPTVPAPPPKELGLWAGLMVIVGGALAYAETHPIAVLAAVAGIAFIAWVVQHNRRGS